MFIKDKNGYAVMVLLMLIPCVIMWFDNGIAWIGFLFAVIEIAIMPFALPVLIILNIICYWTVFDDKDVIALLLTVHGGFIGGFIAANTVNKGFNEREAINIISIINLFLFVIYPLWAYALFEFEIHGMLM